MPLLYPHLRVTQIFGANTEVGKTLLTTSLLRSTAKFYKKQESYSASSTKKKVWYLKPISTGPDSESDVAFVERHTQELASSIKTKNLYQYREPVSPHLARILAPDLDYPKSNDHLLSKIQRHIQQCASSSAGSLYLETAGGVHSPSLHPPMTQLDSLRSLRLPTILVASPHLGGISTTISAYESLLLRGYTIEGVLGIRDNYYKNHEFLKDYFQERGIDFWSFLAPHVKGGLSLDEDRQKLLQWYESIEEGLHDHNDSDRMADVVESLEARHENRLRELDGMPRRALDNIWWPFTQHGMVNKESDVMVIDSAKGDNFDAYYKAEAIEPPASSAAERSLLNPLFDGSASWFTQAHTHAHPRLTLAAAEAAGRYGHVLFPSGAHAPALDLADKLLDTVGKGWAERVFYSDNGSTGIEVALKMALRAAGQRYGWEGVNGEEVGVIGLKGGYHGDTIGSMDAAEQGIYNTVVDWYKGRGFWFSPPEVKIQDGKVFVNSTGNKIDWPSLPMKDYTALANRGTTLWSVQFDNLAELYDVERRMGSSLAEYYRAHIRTVLERITQEVDSKTGLKKKFGALVLEPICLGAGGMVFVDPLFQRVLIDVVRKSGDLFEQETPAVAVRDQDWRGLPVIFDEVFSGLQRMSYMRASQVLGTDPDIAVYAKILSGGLLPLSATVTSHSIFETFLHPTKKVEALLHGHSYTAYPIGCNVALTAIKMIEEQEEAAKKGQGAWKSAQDLWKPQESGLGLRSGVKSLWSFWDREFLYRISKLDTVQGVMAMGTVLAIELREQADEGMGGYASSLALDFLTSLRKSAPITPSAEGQSPFVPFNVHSRPLGNVVYIMTSLWTEREVVKGMEDALELRLSSN